MSAQPADDGTETTAADMTPEEREAALSVFGLPTASENAWPKATPIVSGCTVPFPVEALPPLMADAVREVAESANVDPAIPATAFLGVAAGVIGSRTRVELNPTWHEWGNLYLAVVAESGDGKTPGIRPARDPLIELEDRTQAEHENEKRQAQVLLPILKTTLEQGQKNGHGQDTAGLVALAKQMDGLKATIARDPRVVVDDITPERMAALMEDNGGRLIAMNDEGALFRHMLGLYASKPNLEPFIKAYDGNPLTVDRKGGAGTPQTALRVPRPLLTLISAVQPSTVQQLGETRHLELVERGVVPRVLFAWPQSRVGTRMLDPGRGKPHVAAPAWNDHLLALAGGGDIRTVAFDDTARAEFAAWRNGVEVQLREGGIYRQVRAFAPKIAGSVLRVAGLFTRLDGQTVVTVEYLRRALVLGDYYLANAIVVVESWAGAETATAQKLLSKFRENVKVTPCGDYCPAREGSGYGLVLHVRDASRWARRVATESVVGALEVLEEHGYVRPLDDERFGSTGRALGKKSPHVEVNPAWTEVVA